MVKLPVIVYNRKTQSDVFADAIGLRQKLEAQAIRDQETTGLCLSIRNCIKRAPNSTVPGQHRFGFEKPHFCSL